MGPVEKLMVWCSLNSCGLQSSQRKVWVRRRTCVITMVTRLWRPSRLSHPQRLALPWRRLLVPSPNSELIFEGLSPIVLDKSMWPAANPSIPPRNVHVNVGFYLAMPHETASHSHSVNQEIILQNTQSFAQWCSIKNNDPVSYVSVCFFRLYLLLHCAALLDSKLKPGGERSHSFPWPCHGHTPSFSSSNY